MFVHQVNSRRTCMLALRMEQMSCLDVVNAIVRSMLFSRYRQYRMLPGAFYMPTIVLHLLRSWESRVFCGLLLMVMT